MNKIDKIYIVHYKPLVERKQFLINQFKINNIENYEFCEDYSRDNTSWDTMNQYFKGNNLTPAQICITIAHIEIYKRIINEGHKMCLILEDDAILCNNFSQIFNNYIEKLPDDIDLAFLNDGCGLHAPNITNDIIWYLTKYSRTCCSYLITNIACQKLIDTIIPFKLAIDHELNRQIDLHNLKVYWCEPTIITDGSGTKYPSSCVQWR
jgi:GR25 family glycosyltransferase involved in LPS biosynthesis